MRLFTVKITHSLSDTLTVLFCRRYRVEISRTPPELREYPNRIRLVFYRCVSIDNSPVDPEVGNRRGDG